MPPHRSLRPRPPAPLPARILALLLAALPAGCGGEPAASDAETRAGDRPGLVALAATPAEPVLLPQPDDGIPDRPTFHDFGRVRNGERVTHVFRLENRDPVPVTIKKVKPSCGCTVPRVRMVTPEGEVVRGRVDTTRGDEVLVVPPGAVAEISVEVDTTAVPTKNTHKTQGILVETDSPGSYYLQLEVHIFVERPFDLVPNGIRFGQVALGAEATGSVDVVGVPGFDIEVTGVESVPEGVEVELERAMDGPRPLWRAHVRLTAALASEPGTWTDELRLATRGPEGEPEEPVVLPLTADRVPAIGPSPTRIVFRAGGDAVSERTTVESRLAGLLFAVEEVTFREPAHAEFLSTTCTPVGEPIAGRSAGWELELRVEDAARVTEVVTGVLDLALDDPQHPTVEVLYVVHPPSRSGG